MRLALAGAAVLTVTSPALAEPVGKTAWDLRVQSGSFDSPSCVVRIAGPDISTSILQNRDGRPVLVLARPDWRIPAQKADFDLSIDGAPPVKLAGDLINNLALPPVLEPPLVERLSSARRLEWTLPHGRFVGDVAGFGEAWAALKVCNASQAKPKA